MGIIEKSNPTATAEARRAKSHSEGTKLQEGAVPFWRLFTVAKMGNLTLTDEPFSGDRPHYNPNDKDLSPIHCNI
jgi:hypothetical protein